MKTVIDLKFDIDKGTLVLTNEHGDTYSSKSDELIDFFDREINDALKKEQS